MLIFHQYAKTMRIRVSNLKFQKWFALRKALQNMYEDGTVTRFVNIHGAVMPGTSMMVHRMHTMPGQTNTVGTNRFLPWHRAFLLEFENELRKRDPELTIPYWDWERDQGDLVGICRLDLIKRLTGQEYWRRQTLPDFTIDIDRVPLILKHTRTFLGFTSELEEGPHNEGHMWVETGHMSMIHLSPMDPLFWMHHANVDRIWALWQRKPENRSKKPTLSETDSKLDPWDDTYTKDNINDILKLPSDLAYDYDGPEFAPTTREWNGGSFKKEISMTTEFGLPRGHEEELVISGKVFSEKGQALVGAQIHIWHADQEGKYDCIGANHRGHIVTDASGNYELKSVWPGLYGVRPRHIHVYVIHQGHELLSTQLYFQGDDRIPNDVMAGHCDAKKRILSVYQEDNVRRAAFDFVLQVADAEDYPDLPNDGDNCGDGG